MIKYSVDLVIFGGGVAGLWALDSVSREGYSAALIEKSSLGDGQTIRSQGIIHGGFKYVVPGKYRENSAKEVRNMPNRWLDHLHGKRNDPDLSHVTVNSDFSYFWLSKRTGIRATLESVFSPIGLSLLNSPVKDITPEAPLWFRNSADIIYRAPEPVIDTRSLLEELAKPNASRIFYGSSFKFRREGDSIKEITLVENKTGQEYCLSPRRVVLCAGVGNQEIVNMMGYDEKIMQIRPLRHVFVTGELPDLWGHCIDGGKAMATVTTHYDQDSRKKVWSIGGEIAEDGNRENPKLLITKTHSFLERALSAIDFSKTEWSTFDALRAEEPNNNLLPSGVSVRNIGNVSVCFPTKMALAPVLADTIIKRLASEKLEKYPNRIYRQGKVLVAPYPWQTQ